MKGILLALLCLVWMPYPVLLAQLSNPLGTFSHPNPLSITPSLAGNFGELRPNHFHGGIDLKTGGQEGLEVMSIEDGFVSRIKVSPYGYGKVIYVDHPNGYTSVYAHLQRFNEEVEAYIRKQQFQLESFEVDVYPGREELQVEAGEVIAYSGNTGGSSGPHLHFEIRETSTEVPRNPLRFNIDVKDSKRPVIEALALAPLGAKSTVNNKNQVFRTRVNGSSVVAQQPFHIEGSFVVQVRGYDSQDGSYNHNGIYAISLYVDGVFQCRFKADSIPFDVSRHLNALIDYKYYYYNKARYLELYREQGNALPNLNYRNHGVLELSPGKHDLNIEARDVHGNVQEVAFTVEVGNTGLIEPDAPEEEELLKWDLPHFYDSEAFHLFFPAHCVYEDIPLEITELNTTPYPSIEILHPSIPVQEAFVIKTHLPENNNETGWVVAQVNGDGKPIRALSTRKEDGWLVAESRSFGMFRAYLDAYPPRIKSVNFSNGKSWNYGQMKFIVNDGFSGVDQIDVRINGKWMRYEYEPKQDLITIDVIELPQQEGKQELLLKVTDLAGNVATFEGNFIRE